MDRIVKQYDSIPDYFDGNLAETLQTINHQKIKPH